MLGSQEFIDDAIEPGSRVSIGALAGLQAMHLAPTADHALMAG